MITLTEISDERAAVLRARIAEHTKGPGGTCTTCDRATCWARAEAWGELVCAGRSPLLGRG